MAKLLRGHVERLSRPCVARPPRAARRTLRVACGGYLARAALLPERPVVLGVIARGELGQFPLDLLRARRHLHRMRAQGRQAGAAGCALAAARGKANAHLGVRLLHLDGRKLQRKPRKAACGEPVAVHRGGLRVLLREHARG